MTTPLSKEEIPGELIYLTGEIRDIQFPKQGQTSDVGIVNGEKGTYIVKRSKEEPFRSWLVREEDVLRHLQGTGLPVPKVYGSAATPAGHWLVLEVLEGEPIRSALSRETDETKRRSLLFQFGQALARLHVAPCPVGLIEEGNWLDRQLETATYNSHHYQVDGTAELLDRLKTSKPRAIEQKLIHGDFTVDNVLAAEGKVTGIIDWSGGAFGDPRYDLALAIRPKPGMFERTEDREIFFEGYGMSINREEYVYFADGLYEFF
ncbi:phosphotransferase family protein [Sporosarcina sp. Te-1]|uniref:phosphotransferase family protein n=1 Tax=Sporosarcina sp. Te-1 TaxID=2818390 RepID=UPI001A9F18B6|nr:phosphotransferase [Sporosarcina sp. Te-1]QTD39921.1 phosphotransferase [Sporosarcina sp. Te-1]